MKITSDLFHAYLKCSTKCWLRATRGLVTENKYPEWVEAQNYSYRTTEVARLVAASPKSELVHSPNMKDVKTAKWRLASSLATNWQTDSNILESELHAVELVPAKGGGHSAPLLPIPFIFTHNTNKDTNLLLAFDAST